MAEKALIKRWVEKAEEDFGYASLSMKEGLSFFPQICWHFQQAAVCALGSNRNYQLFIPATLFPITQTAAAILYAVSLLLQGAFCL
jgi:hypothetical protein